jgi:UDP-3-O-[3-hydroxymyristoyl] glucosamine N-acyltransferase
MNIKELAARLGALSVENATGSEEITHAAGIEDSGTGAVSFIGNPHYERFLSVAKATAVIVSEHLQASGTASQGNGQRTPALIRVKSPYEAFATALEIFKPKDVDRPAGVHPSAVIEPDATVDPSASIAANAYIGARCRIGAGTWIGPCAVVEQDSTIGSNSSVHPNAVVCHRTEIGDRVVVGPGSIIGFDGFGYVPMGDGSYRKIPQIGRVVLEDDVEIGANTTVDRATVAETRIRKGAKLDNLIQIAHNVEVGEHTVIAAQTGISGSTTIGNSNIIAGQVGIVGHITTTDHVIVGAQSGLSKSITKPGTYFGSPVKNHRDALKLEGALRSLPELIERVKRLEQMLEEQSK